MRCFPLIRFHGVRYTKRIDWGHVSNILDKKKKKRTFSDPHLSLSPDGLNEDKRRRKYMRMDIYLPPASILLFHPRKSRSVVTNLLSRQKKKKAQRFPTPSIDLWPSSSPNWAAFLYPPPPAPPPFSSLATVGFQSAKKPFLSWIQ